VLSGDKVKLVIIGQPKSQVQQVEIMDQNVVTVWAASLARRLAIYTARRSVPVNLLPTKTPRRRQGGVHSRVSMSPTFLAANVPVQRRLSSRTTLKNWAISKIIWHAHPQV